MTQTILDYSPFSVYPENYCCENCLHWGGDYHHQIYAKIANETVWVGQCHGIEESDDAPFADLDNGAEAVVFTPRNGRCKAFEIDPSIEGGAQDEAATYQQLDRELHEDAWMGV